MKFLIAVLLLAPALCFGQVQPPINPHVDCNGATHDCRIHYLLPSVNYYDLTQALTHSVDIPYAVLDPNGWSNHLQITKATLTLHGPQVLNMGFAALILEDNDADTRAGAVWDPFIIVVDGQFHRSETFAPGIRMTNGQQLCFEYQNRPYSAGQISGIYAMSSVRAVWVDLWYHVGD